jgi:hypothetical protein
MQIAQCLHVSVLNPSLLSWSQFGLSLAKLEVRITSPRQPRQLLPSISLLFLPPTGTRMLFPLSIQTLPIYYRPTQEAFPAWSSDCSRSLGSLFPEKSQNNNSKEAPSYQVPTWCQATLTLKGKYSHHPHFETQEMRSSEKWSDLIKVTQQVSRQL